MSDLRNVLFLIVTVMIIQVSGGLTGTQYPLGLDEMGVGPVGIGLTAALNALGYILGALTASAVIIRLGNVRVFCAAAAINAASVLSLSLVQDPLWWGLVRLLQGAAFAYMFVSIEGWLGAAVSAQARGNAMGLYHTGAKLALLVGPFLIAGKTALDPSGFVWAALFLIISLVPVCLSRQREPVVTDRGVMPFARLFALAPAALVGAAVSGLANTGTMALLPVYFGDFKPNGRRAPCRTGSSGA
jgi:MFS family permease